MLDLGTDFGKRVKRRLQEDEVIWFTSVSPRGIPNPNPVWFYWDGQIIIVYSQPESYRIRNIRHNPHVSLHLEGAAAGDNIIIINGEAELVPSYEALEPGYLKKYAKLLPGISLTPEEMAASYSVKILVKNLRVRGE